MGGSSSGQVTGYKYLTNFLLFIGNPIEKLLNINFDKRGWIANERISYGSNGEMIYIENINLYGENEGGVAGTMRVKHGTNNQTASTQYKKYMASLGLPASAYPYQSYIMFGGGGFPQGSWDLTEEELETIGDELEENDKYYNRGAFYVGNSGYMKEMLLWPKRIHVRNDGRGQWYDEKAEVPDRNIIEIPGCAATQSGFKFSATVNSIYKLDSSPESNLSTIVYGETTGNKDSVIFTTSSNGVVQNGSTDTGLYYTEITLPILQISGLCKCVISGLFFGDGIKSDFGGDIDVINEYTTGLRKEIFINYCSDVKPISFRVDIDRPAQNLDGGDYSIGGSIRIDIYNPVDNEPVFATSGDINPIHKIREILTDDTAMNKPESSVNDDNFIKAADWIYDEGLGVSSSKLPIWQ